jgi:hypothetical protein
MYEIECAIRPARHGLHVVKFSPVLARGGPKRVGSPAANAADGLLRCRNTRLDRIAADKSVVVEAGWAGQVKSPDRPIRWDCVVFFWAGVLKNLTDSQFCRPANLLIQKHV